MEYEYFSRSALDNSPSAKDGVTAEQERQYRRKTCQFVDKCAQRFKPPMPKLAVATAQVFFHRFFSRQSFRAHDRMLIATACLHLAGKVQESPRKLSVVSQVMHVTLNKGADPLARESEAFKKLKESILIAERVLLHTIAFDLDVEHPYQDLVPLVQRLRIVDKERKQLLQTAWNFVNDSLSTNLCLQFPPRTVACATMHMAAKYLKLPEAETGVPGAADRVDRAGAGGGVGGGGAEADTVGLSKWAKDFGVPRDALFSVCSQILELYAGQAQGLDPKMAAVSESVARLAPKAPSGGLASRQPESNGAGGGHRDKRQRVEAS